jgi:hypothetical protein
MCLKKTDRTTYSYHILRCPRVPRLDPESFVVIDKAVIDKAVIDKAVIDKAVIDKHEFEQLL